MSALWNFYCSPPSSFKAFWGNVICGYTVTSYPCMRKYFECMCSTFKVSIRWHSSFFWQFLVKVHGSWRQYILVYTMVCPVHWFILEKVYLKTHQQWPLNFFKSVKIYHGSHQIWWILGIFYIGLPSPYDRLLTKHIGSASLHEKSSKWNCIRNFVLVVLH